MAVILYVPENTIQLPNPNPEFSDVEQLKSTINVLRTKTGVRHTYVKNRTRRRFVWNFTLRLLKAWELRAFVDAYLSRTLIVRDFDNEIWQGVIKSNPIQFTQTSKDEVTDVTLELELSRVSPRYITLEVQEALTVDDEATGVPKVRLTVPTGLSVPVDTPSGFNPWIVAYYDPLALLEMTLNDAGGNSVFDLPPGTTITGGFPGTSFVKFEGTASDIDAALEGMQLTCNLTGARSFTASVEAPGGVVTTKTVNFTCV